MTSKNTFREAGRWVKRTRLRLLRTVSNDKIRANTLLNQREIWQGRTRLHAFPREIQVGTNWTCNLRCYFCRRQTDQAGRLAGLSPEEREIPPAALERVLQIMPFAEVFILTPLGEPLMYSGFSRLLEHSRATNSRNLHITTNGNLTTEDRAREIVQSGMRRIYVSIDSANPDLYAQMRPGANLGRVSDGLKYLHDWKQRLRTLMPEVIIASTFSSRNIAGLPDLVRYARAHHVDKLSVQLMEADDPALALESLAHHIPLTLDALSQARRLAGENNVQIIVHLALRNLLSAHAHDPNVAQLLAQDQNLDMRGRNLMDKCLYPWTFLVVDTNGDARPCCWTAMTFGNLALQSFDDVWNSPAARNMRRDFLKNQIPLCCRDKFCRVDL